MSPPRRIRPGVGRVGKLTAMIAASVGVAAGRWARLRRRRDRITWSEPQGTVQVGTLAVRTSGSGNPPVVLLHGLAGSGRYWGAEYDRLAERSRLVVPDLLGFGASPRPPSGYGAHQHTHALAATLADIGVESPALVVGHSLGSLVALAFAARYPERVRAIVAFAPPLYRDRAAAARHVARLGLTTRVLGQPGPVAAAACRWMCRHRPQAARVAEWWRPDLPPVLARDGVQHSWASYSQTFEAFILAADGPAWLDAVAVPVRVVVGTDDPVPDVAFLEELAVSRPHVVLSRWAAAGHDLPLTDPQRCLEEIGATLEDVDG